MNLKRIKFILKVFLYNLTIIYFLILIVDFLVKENELTSDHLIVNIKRFDKNSTYQGKVSPGYFHTIDGEIKENFKLRTGELGDIKVEKTNLLAMQKIDYLFMGGSTTECMYVDEDKRFPYLINQSLPDSINVINLSKSGKNSHHSFLQLNTQLNDLAIKNLILMHNVNDLIQLLYYKSYTNGAFTRVSVIDPENLNPISNKPFHIPYNLINLLKKTISQSFPVFFYKIREINFLRNNADEFKGDRTKENKVDPLIYEKFENNIRSIVYI